MLPSSHRAQGCKRLGLRLLAADAERPGHVPLGPPGEEDGQQGDGGGDTTAVCLVMGSEGQGLSDPVRQVRR